MNHFIPPGSTFFSRAKAACLAGGWLLGGIASWGADIRSSGSTNQFMTETTMVLTVDTPWVVAADEPEAIQRALADVKADWYKVLGRMPVVLTQPPQSWTGSIIYFGTKAPWLKEMLTPQTSGPESFVLRVRTDRAGRTALVAGGGDLRGAIYAAYALSEEVLGVDPWYYWVDKEPAFRGRVELRKDFDRSSGAPTFRYRGWFINDEDLLSRFAPDPLRENIFSLEMWDRVYETLLRLRGNMVVPGTFNLPDERCQELAARRGLILNMHHINVLGLVTFRWPEDVPFSYSKHPEIMERYWRTCIAAYKDWEVVWPDDGSGGIRDNGRVGAGQGTYYHTMMLNHQGNQLTEMVNPGRIYHELGRFTRAGATEYFLVNVSDERPSRETSRSFIRKRTDPAVVRLCRSQRFAEMTHRESQEATGHRKIDGPIKLLIAGFRGPAAFRAVSLVDLRPAFRGHHHQLHGPTDPRSPRACLAAGYRLE